jgi:hypothetical protein
MSQVFTCLLTYVTSVVSGYFKSRSDVTHVAMWPTCRNTLLLLGRHRGSPCGCLRPADAFAACIHRRGEVGTLLSVSVLQGHRLIRERAGRASVTWGRDWRGRNGCARTRAASGGLQRQDVRTLAFPFFFWLPLTTCNTTSFCTYDSSGGVWVDLSTAYAEVLFQFVFVGCFRFYWFVCSSCVVARLFDVFMFRCIIIQFEFLLLI